MAEYRESHGQFIGRITFENADNLLARLGSVIPKGDGEIISCILLELYYLVYFIIVEKPDRLKPEEMNRIYNDSLEALKNRTKAWSIKPLSGPFEGDILPYDHSTLSLGMIYWMANFLESNPDLANNSRSQQLEHSRVHSKRRLLEGLADSLDVESENIIELQIDFTLTQLINAGPRLSDPPWKQPSDTWRRTAGRSTNANDSRTMKHELSQLFNRIYVLESLPASERHTGKELHDDMLRWKADLLPHLSVVYASLNSKGEFLTYLGGIATETENHTIYPIIHIEAHGSETGLKMASGEFIVWEELRKQLTQINVNVMNNLFVTLAACRGAYLAFLLKPTDRSPVWGLAGPVIDVNERDLVVSFQAFYDELLTNFNGDRAAKRMNQSMADLPYRYETINCLSLFKDAYSTYLEELDTIEGRKQRSGQIADRVLMSGQSKGLARRRIKRQAQKHMRKTQKGKFKQFRDTFFMIDLYPENEKRFSVSLSDITGD